MNVECTFGHIANLSSQLVACWLDPDIVCTVCFGTVIHGAGGMEMLDPLFQRILVQECRKRCIPVIFDEVFSGCWRFGTEVCALYSFLHPKHFSRLAILLFGSHVEVLVKQEVHMSAWELISSIVASSLCNCNAVLYHH